MSSESWCTAYSRDWIEEAVGVAYRCLIAIAAELVTQPELETKALLAHELRRIANCTQAMAARYADLRGDVSELPARARTRIDGEPGSLVEALARLAALASAGPWPADSQLDLADWDTARTFERVAEAARRCQESLSTRRWTLLPHGGPPHDEPPRRPGRPTSLQVIDLVGPADANLAAALHGAMFSVELCAAELCAQTIALDAWVAPLGCVVDLAKQVEDEMRHFRMLENLMQLRGGRIGDYPIDTLIWDKFLLATDLTERLVIEQRLGEGAGLDGGLALYDKFARERDELGTRCMDFINADEMTHVRNGNKWILHQLGSPDAVRELELQLRDRLAAAGWPVTHREPINVEDRTLAGFNVAEILEIRSAANSGWATTDRA